MSEANGGCSSCGNDEEGAVGCDGLCEACRLAREIINLRARLDAEHAAHLAEIHAHKATKALLARAVGVVRESEWMGHSPDVGQCCPSCGGALKLPRVGPNLPHEGHAPYCKTAAVLKETP